MAAICEPSLMMLTSGKRNFLTPLRAQRYSGNAIDMAAITPLVYTEVSFLRRMSSLKPAKTSKLVSMCTSIDMIAFYCPRLERNLGY